MLIFMISVLLLSSCISQKKLKYLQNKSGSEVNTEFINERNVDYKVQPGDNLYIKVSSIDERTSGLFNTVDQRYANNIGNDVSVYLNSYTVNEEGYVEFPLAGKIEVKDKTIEQIKSEIKILLSEYLKETLVIVKLVNFNITLLGEVKRPGEYKIYQDKINIFEAISFAGDLGDFADRNKVSLIRQTKSGSKIHRLDLTDARILESDYYYLMPNDILYVEPLKGKQFAFANFPYALIFSAVSTTLLLINFFK
jgi:polysaccharide biosynthesis/export protein